LTQRVVQAQEAERGHVALELHDHITQLLCAVLVRSQSLADKLSAGDRAAQSEAIKLRELLGQTAEEVERISRELRPSVLDELGLVAVLREATAEFAARTGLAVTLDCGPLMAELPAATRLALYRIFQEAMKNVERHAQARHVSVWLRQSGPSVQLVIQDDGIGFDLDPRPARRKNGCGFGLLSMRERATYVRGSLKINSTRRAGTSIEIRVPVGKARTGRVIYGGPPNPATGCKSQKKP
jgi:signal transduction histidine kinase